MVSHEEGEKMCRYVIRRIILNSSCLRRSHRKCNHDVFVSKNDRAIENGTTEDERDRKWRVME